MLNVKGTINYLEKHGANRIIKILDKRETKELREMYKELVNYDLDLHEHYTSQTGMLKFRYDF